MFESVKDWVQAHIGQGYRMVDGGFIDGTAFEKDYMCVIKGKGGAAPDVDDRRPRYQLILLGPRNNRPAVAQVRAATEALMEACLGDTVPCGAASVKALGEPVGPSYTVEDRAWMTVELQLTH